MAVREYHKLKDKLALSKSELEASQKYIYEMKLIAKNIQKAINFYKKLVEYGRIL